MMDSRWCRLALVIFLGVSAPSLTNTVFAGAQVPCGDASTGLSDCKEVKERSKTLVHARVAEIVECWYQPSGAKCQGIGALAPRMCSVLGNSLVGAEIESNHKGQSCGEWSRVDTKYRVTQNGFSIRVDSDSTVTGSGSGGREGAYTAGAYVSATSCWLNRIKKMIDAGEVTIGACTAISKDITSILAKFKESSGHVKNANLRDILNKCDSKTQAEVSKRYSGESESESQAEALDQKNCRLVAQRSSLEALFQQLAVCEVMAQANKSFNQFQMSALDPGAMEGRIDKWTKACKGCQADSECQNKCYQDHYLDFIKGKVGEAFGSCG